jgi:fused signal recognition particle receptor
MERLLLESDFGIAATTDLVELLEEGVRRGRLKSEDDLKLALRDRIAELLASPGDPGAIARAASGPTVVLFVGVNGTGKTTSIAKLARYLSRRGDKVLLAAADTYRAGAVAQLEVWAERLGLPCVSGASGGDPAAVAFDAVTAAETRGATVLIVDTAGRLHTQEGLMDELRKVVRVIGRRAPGAPHETLLVLDGSVGQNAVQQGKLFSAAVQPTGIIVTKLDGTARGGAVVALRRELALPIRFLGTGEDADDLEVFDPGSFAEDLVEGAGS